MLDYKRLGDSMLYRWNSILADEATINRLGDVLYDGIISIKMAQESTPDGSLGRERARETAKAMLNEFCNAAGQTNKKRFRQLALAILWEITQNADILPLTVTNTPSDGAGHTHAPAQTQREGGRIQ